MEPVIELSGVGFSARDRVLVSALSCRFAESRATALAGPPGCGKSTVLKLAAGLLIPDRGEVRFRGMPLARMGRQQNLDFRRETAFVFQDAALWANQTLFETLELPLRVHFPAMPEAARRRRVEEVAARVGYRRELGVRPSELSRGEQKLVAFARALVCRPPVLFLDEWTESLDENSARRLTDIVLEMKAAGATVILVTHDVRIMRRVADTVLLVKDGGIERELACGEACGELERIAETG